MTSDTRLLLVGCGKMGGALLKAVVKSDLASSIQVIEPTPPDDLKSAEKIIWLSSPEKIVPTFQPDIIILAIKPQAMAAALPDYKHFNESVFLSIAAGVTLRKIASLLASDAASIVRVMPNLPASIGKGMSVAIANYNVRKHQRDLCDRFLKAIGETAWVEDEKVMDAVTALSGSGPAYIFALGEAMAKAGEALGLTRDMAMHLARQTLIGSAALLEYSSEDVESLRHAVTSPGGTTEAALKYLDAPGALQDLVLKSMTAAAERAKELST